MIQDPRVIAAIEDARKRTTLPSVPEMIESLRLCYELINAAEGVLGWHWLEKTEHIWEVLKPLDVSLNENVHLRRALDPDGSWKAFEIDTRAITLTIWDNERADAFLTKAKARWPKRVTLRARPTRLETETPS